MTPKIYSEGTLRVSDLLAAYFGALHDVNYKEYEKQYKKKKNKKLLETEEYEFYENQAKLEEANWLLDELSDKINESIPENYFFGHHDGDPCCVGIFELGSDDK